MIKVLLTGSNGQLGKSIIQLKPVGIELIKISRNECDLLDPVSCGNLVTHFQPDWVINCAAYTNVDKAAREKEIALALNADVPKKLAEELIKVRGKLLHISTDFVFNGDQNYAYKTNQKRSPVNFYGYTKAQGEENIEKILGGKNQAVIIRTSWLISPFGNNFVLKMLELNNRLDEISVVCDQIGCPTSSFELAKACWNVVLDELLFTKRSSTDLLILHWSNTGIASWYDLAYEISSLGKEFGLIKNSAIINPIKSIYYSSPEERPKFSLLDCDSTYNLLELKPPYWRESLKEIIGNICTKN